MHGLRSSGFPNARSNGPRSRYCAVSSDWEVAGMIDQHSSSIGRFDQSFLIHMIRDFFFVLVIVTVVEFC